MNDEEAVVLSLQGFLAFGIYSGLAYIVLDRVELCSPT